MRPPRDAAEDRLAVGEELAIRKLGGLVQRERHRLASIGRRERDLVRRHRPILDRPERRPDGGGACARAARGSTPRRAPPGRRTPSRRSGPRAARAGSRGRGRPARDGDPDTGPGGSVLGFSAFSSRRSFWGSQKNSKWRLRRDPLGKRLQRGLDVLAPDALVQLVGGQQPQAHGGHHPERAERRRARRRRRAARSSRSTRAGSPSAVRRRSPTTWFERLRRRLPVPCVPVAIAPASACTSTSPRFSIASPARAAARRAATSRVPARTRRFPGGRIAGLDSRQRVQLEQQAVGRHQRRVRVSAAGDAHAEPLGGGAAQQRRQLRLARRAFDALRRAAHAPRPVAPGLRHAPRSRAEEAGAWYSARFRSRACTRTAR